MNNWERDLEVAYLSKWEVGFDYDNEEDEEDEEDEEYYFLSMWEDYI